MVNPTIEELQNEEKFELIAELNHQEIKSFVVKQLSEGGWLVKSYMIYQLTMLVLAAFIITRAVIFAFEDNLTPLYYIIAAILFCFSLLIVIHELLHGVAIKLTGAPKVNYGAYIRKFIFYAEADQHVLNKNQFTVIALAPFVVVKTITAIGSVLFFSEPILFFLVLTMCAHSLFCAGDIGLLSIFYKNKNKAIFTYDIRAKKKSYYFRRK